MNRFLQSLQSAGLTNKDSEDYSTLAGAKKKLLTAYCSSKECSHGFGGRAGKVKPFAKRGSIDCVDCGHALFWTLED